MGKTTGYTASIVAQMLGNGVIGGRGVVAPEKAVAGEHEDLLVSELGKRGVKIAKGR